MAQVESKKLALIFQFLQFGMGPLRQSAHEAAPRKPAPSRSAAINRWTGKPHEHFRAKARRLAQLERK